MTRTRISNWVSSLALILAVLGALCCLWIGWCEYPFQSFNEMRLAPAFAVQNGINPYPALGEGPLFTWIYGPVGIFVNLPATWAGTVLGALRTAAIINALIVLTPLAVIFLGSAELRTRGKIACGYAIAVSALLIPRPNLTSQTPDNVAIACGLLSLWWLARRSTPTNTQLAVAAALATLAIWSKQIALFLPIAHVVFLLLAGQRRAAGCYLGWLACFNLIALVIFAWMFGFQNLWLNLVEVPGRLAWAELPSKFRWRKWFLIGQVALPSVILLLLWRTHRWPSNDTEKDRFFQLGALAYGVMLPVGMVAFCKIGGDINSLHSWDYFMPAGLLLWLNSDRLFPANAARMLAVTVLSLATRGTDFAALPARPYTQHLDFAAELIARHPQTIWFPQNPLITYYADHRLWHTEDGVSTRFLAGYRIREAEFRRYLPPNLEAVAYPSVNNFPFAMPLLSDFSKKERVPYWGVYTRPQPEKRAISAEPESGNLPGAQP